MGLETCNNCERTIGNLEQAYVFRNKVVCEKCYSALTSELEPSVTRQPRKKKKKKVALVQEEKNSEQNKSYSKEIEVVSKVQAASRSMRPVYVVFGLTLIFLIWWVFFLHARFIWGALVVAVAGFFWLRFRLRGKSALCLSKKERYSVDVVGESHYQKELESICGGRTEDGHNKIVKATLVLENDNPYDNEAVRVDIAGKTVGHLNRECARTHRKNLKKAKHGRKAVTCSAVIVGGWNRGDGDTGYFGVRLNLPKEL